ncbi:hypothetical protein [Aeromonas veronii]|uniref:Fimbrial-type adhesion domain-containing protein n=1 Tax=Aeromonas veronii AMC34 TaxID=1073383 RepID=K1JDL5_AERVE|nr:hypothetical protein [Aeromonas veronii]EKB17619.1 hypothetical protein HMPREF1168_03846 [Aeromonas veronii AMC34]
MKAAMLYRYGWLLLSCLTGLANAASITITAEYNPANYVEDRAIFINTTPCTQSLVNWCSGTASIDKPQAVYISTNTYRQVKDTDDKRYGVHYLTFPAARDVSVINTVTGHTYPFKFILTDIGTQTVMDNPGRLPEQGDCINNKSSESHSALFQFSNIKESKQLSGGVCYSDLNHLSKTVRITSLYLGYKLKSPSPLTMPNGTYRGKINFVMGENKDFDLGGGTYGDTFLEVNFIITVKHQMKIEFPADANKVTLQPREGWAEWIHRGRVPTSLQGEISYRVWTTAPYGVTVRCGELDGNYCLLNNEQTGYKARIRVLSANPYSSGFAYLTPGRTHRFSVVLDGVGDVGRERIIRFTINQTELGEVLKKPGGTYKGTVTLIYEAVL